MSIPTLNFEPTEEDNDFIKEISEADKAILEEKGTQINFSPFYNPATISNYVNLLKENAAKRNMSQDELFFEMLKSIISLVNTRIDFKRYDDISFYFSYLINKFEINKAQNYVKPAVFFKADDPEMKDIINIILVEYKNLPPIFYILEKSGENFRIRPIEPKEVLSKLEEYSNYTVDYFFETKAKEALPRQIII